MLLMFNLDWLFFSDQNVLRPVGTSAGSISRSCSDPRYEVLVGQLVTVTILIYS